MEKKKKKWPVNGYNKFVEEANLKNFIVTSLSHTSPFGLPRLT